MTDKEKLEAIKAEIERLMYSYNQEADIASAEDSIGEKVAAGKYDVCRYLLSLIDSLQEEPVSEDYKKARKEAMFSINEQKGYSFKLQDMFDAGANWQKQQLMKKAIEGIVTTNIDGWINVMTGFIRPEEAGANFGNKVKLIIIKEEGV